MSIAVIASLNRKFHLFQTDAGNPHHFCKYMCHCWSGRAAMNLPVMNPAGTGILHCLLERDRKSTWLLPDNVDSINGLLPATPPPLSHSPADQRNACVRAWHSRGSDAGWWFVVYCDVWKQWLPHLIFQTSTLLPGCRKPELISAIYMLLKEQDIGFTVATKVKWPDRSGPKEIA